MAMCSVALMSCGDETQEMCPQGYYGTYVTPQKHVPGSEETFCEVVVLDERSCTTYTTSAVNSQDYWGEGSIPVPGVTGWYVESSSAQTVCYTKQDDKIIAANGTFFSLSGKCLTMGKTVYLKMN